MKRLVLSLVFFAACSYADITPLTCTNANTVTGVLGASIGSATSGCLEVSTPPNNNQGTSDNTLTAGLWVNPATDQSSPNFQTDGLTVAWAVTNEGSGVYQYEYTFSETANGNQISHIIVGTGCTSATTTGDNSNCIYNLSAVSNILPYTPLGLNSKIGIPPTGAVNPALPWSTEALTVLPNTGAPNNFGYTIDFDSTDAPTWQNVYVRDGGEQAEPSTIEAWNNSGSGFYVAAPAPEAGFYVLFAVFMAGLLLAFRFSRKQRAQA